jgi:HAD superfamily phosphatase
VIVSFDVDGVLVEVSQTYHRALAETVGKFLDRPIPQKEILNLKAALKLNNDWDATVACLVFYQSGLALSEFLELASPGLPDYRKFYLLARKLNIKLPDYSEVKLDFENVYHRYQSHEDLRINPQILAEIRKMARVMAVITGRTREDLDLTFRQHGLYRFFDYFITEDDLPSVDDRKPATYPLRQLLSLTGFHSPVCYIGDTETDQLMVENYEREENKKVIFILFEHQFNQQVAADFKVNRAEDLLTVLVRIIKAYD